MNLTGSNGYSKFDTSHRTRNTHQLSFYFLVLLASCLLLLSFMFGCVPQESVNQGTTVKEPQKRVPKLTSVVVSDYRMVISADAPFEFALYKPNPLLVFAELKDVTPGAHKGTIEPDVSGLNEIKVYPIETPIEGTRIEIVLSTPKEVELEYNNGVLTLLY